MKKPELPDPAETPELPTDLNALFQLYLKMRGRACESAASGRGSELGCGAAIISALRIALDEGDERV